MPKKSPSQGSSDTRSLNASEQDLCPRPIEIHGVPRKGVRLTVSLSDEEKEKLKGFYDLQDITDFNAKLKLEKKTTTQFRLVGEVRADVVQSCVVSLKAVHTKIAEDIDLRLVPASEFEKYMERTDEEGLLVVGMEGDVPDTYDQDVIDVGGLVLEHFALGLNPYPRAENVEIDQSLVGDDATPSAFADLAALKEKMKPS